MKNVPKAHPRTTAIDIQTRFPPSATPTKPVADYIPVGTGPFAFVGWPQHQDVDLVRYDDYTSPPSDAPHTGSAYVHALDFDIVSDDATRYGALTSGQVDGIADVPPIDVKSLAGTSGFYVQSDALPGLNCTSVRLVVFTVACTPLVTELAKPCSATSTE